LGAASPLVVTIGGKECTPRPLSVKELTEVERDCLYRYRDRYLETWSQSMKFFPDGQGVALLEKRVEEAARWDPEDLPPRDGFDSRRIVLTDALKNRLREVYNYDEKEETSDLKWQRMAAGALQSQMLSEAEYENLTGKKPIKTKIAYTSWWITGSYDGQITFCWKCFSEHGVTRDQVIETMRGRRHLLADVSHEIDKLSASQLGNG
jgi:hypothetical protein